MKVTLKSSTVKLERARASAGSKSAPARKSSYWLSVLAKPSLVTTITPPLNPHSAPTAKPDQHDQHREVEEQVAGLAQVAALGGDRPPRRPRRSTPPGSACACTPGRRGLEDRAGALAARGARAAGRGSAAPSAAARVRRASRPAAAGRCSPPARPSAGCRSRRTTPSRRPRTARASRRSGSAAGAGRATGRPARESTASCGTTDPGTAASASRNSRISAVRIEVSWRQAQRASPTGAAPGPAPCAGGGTHRHTPASKPGKNQVRSQPTSTSHQPVTSSSPTAISISPPMAVTQRWWRRTQPTCRASGGRRARRR